MKKCITFMVTALCMTFMSAMTSNAADKIIYGDVNGDSAVDAADISAINAEDAGITNWSKVLSF